MDQDVVIIGGSFAGIAAAMQLARARRNILIIDAGEPRNRFARTSHGFIGQDGVSPAAIRAKGRAELAAYPTVEFLDSLAASITREGSGFVTRLTDGQDVTSRRVILAFGVRDSLPDLPGLAERWGISVLHCPYCHGYELNQQPVGVLARDTRAVHQAMMLPDWGPTTLFTQGLMTLSAEQQAALDARGVRVEETPVAELLGDSPALEGARLTDGRIIALAGLFIAPQAAPACNLAHELGCTFQDGPTGPVLTVDAMHATPVPGVFAAGDLTTPMANATLAAAGGVMAGNSAHRSLIFDPGLKAGT